MRIIGLYKQEIVDDDRDLNLQMFCKSDFQGVFLIIINNADFSCFSGAGGKLVEPTPEIQRELAAELEKVAKQFGGGEGVDMTSFPSFKFT
ncbi:hypothetical protein ANN_10307, partial [Periplaneta americana]